MRRVLPCRHVLQRLRPASRCSLMQPSSFLLLPWWGKPPSPRTASPNDYTLIGYTQGKTLRFTSMTHRSISSFDGTSLSNSAPLDERFPTWMSFIREFTIFQIAARPDPLIMRTRC
jgi:hypothetical protein